MKVFTIILSVLAIMALLSTLICGLWIGKQNLTGADLQSSIAFHMKLGISACLLSLGSIGLMLFKYVK